MTHVPRQLTDPYVEDFVDPLDVAWPALSEATRPAGPRAVELAWARLDRARNDWLSAHHPVPTDVVPIARQRAWVVGNDCAVRWRDRQGFLDDVAGALFEDDDAADVDEVDW